MCVQEVNGKSLQSLMAFLDDMKKPHYIDSPSQAAAGAPTATYDLAFYLLPSSTDDMLGQEGESEGHGKGKGKAHHPGGATILPRSSLAEKEKAPHIIPLKRVATVLHTSLYYSKKGKVSQLPCSFSSAHCVCVPD
jgi:hypothetical protein